MAKIRISQHFMFVALVASLSGCSDWFGGDSGDDEIAGAAPVTTTICPGPDAQAKALVALFDAHEGDTIQFCEGTFAFTTGLILHSKKGVTIRGAGRDKTML